MTGAGVWNYIRRANDFYDGMRAMRGDPRLRYSTALLAIHSAISYGDALRTGLGDSKLHGEDHLQAVGRLKALLVENQFKDRDGLAHLSQLIGRKNSVAYRSERLDEAECTTLVTKAERFATWVNQTGRKLRVEGWEDVDN